MVAFCSISGPMKPMRTISFHPAPKPLPLFQRLIAVVTIGAQLCLGLPMTAHAATPAIQPPRAAALPPPVRTPQNIKVNRAMPAHAPASQVAAMSADPNDAEVGALRLFPHRLQPVGDQESGSTLKRLFGGGNAVAANPNENRSLATQLAALQNNSDPHATAPLDSFVRANPKSRWAPSLRHELARRLFAQGFFTRAISEWETVWSQVKDGRDAGSLAVGDEVLSHLIEVCMGLSDTRRLTDLIGALPLRR